MDSIEENYKSEKLPYKNCLTEKGLKMMEKMGYVKGMGLGKTNKVNNVVEVTMKQDRHGFGFKEKFQAALNNINWDRTNEVIEVRQKIEWISSNTDLHEFSSINLNDWMIFEERVPEYPNDNRFCDATLQHDLQTAKELLELFESNELRRIRSRANPFESIRNVFFLNRAALKMANIDAVCNFMFTNIENDSNHICTNKPFYFADVCAGPGGFSEYILWRKKWLYKGFGFTLKEGENDFKLNEFVAGTPESFQLLYGKKQDGNIYDPENICEIRERILLQTYDKGVHFMMSDGGFSVDGYENLQELLSKQLYLCQCLVALSIVRENGHFVTKLFDTFTLFSVGLIYLMYKCFDEVCILKPNASRPANSERYLICKRKKRLTEAVRSYLEKINNTLWSSKNLDIISIVPYDVLIQDTQFYKYIVEINNNLCKRQIISLNKIMAFSKDLTLVECRQADLRTQCLQYWNIPDLQRSSLVDLVPDKYINNLSNHYKTDFLLSSYVYIENKTELLEKLNNSNKWNLCYLSEKLQYKFYLGCGGKKVYELNENRWQLTTSVNIEVPRGTLLIGEFVEEIGVRSKAKKSYSLHVIDAFQLGDLDISELHFERRRELIEIFCESINQPYHSNLTNIKIKPIYPFKMYETNENNLKFVEMTNGKLVCHLSSTYNFPTSFRSGFVLFINFAHRFEESYKQWFCCKFINNINSAGLNWKEFQSIMKDDKSY